MIRARLIACLCFWLAPTLTIGSLSAWVAYNAPSVGHSFEYGAEGATFSLLITAMLATLNLGGFGLALCVVPRLNVRCHTRFYLFSAVAGFLSFLGFALVGWGGGQITSTSGIFWVSFFVAGALVVSSLVSLCTFYIALWLGWLIRGYADSLCQGCGYDLRASHTGSCPECGEAILGAPGC